MSVTTRPGPLWLGAAGAAVLLVVLLVNLPAADTPVAASTQAGALRVQLDPETGEMVPVTGLDKAEFERQLDQRLDRSGAGLTEVHHSDGSVSMDLQGRFQSLSVATTDSAGNVHTGCVTNKDEAHQFLDLPKQDRE